MKRLIISALAVTILIAVANAIAGAAVSDLFTQGGYNAVFALLIAIALIVLGFWLALRLASEILSSRARMIISPTETRRRVLILGLSDEPADKLPLYDGLAKSIGSTGLALPVQEFEELVLATAFPADTPMAEYAERLNSTRRPPQLKWQQNIRAIGDHGSELEAIYVLPSTESIEKFPAFSELLKKLFPKILVRQVMQRESAVTFHVGGDLRIMSYENYDYVHSGLKRAIEQAQNEINNCRGTQDICIDCSPGQKPFSIAAAIVTLNNDLLLSYVTTGNEGGMVKYYDASITLMSPP